MEAPGIEFGQEVPRGFGECGRIATKWLKFSSIAGPSEWSAFHSVRSGSASFLEGYGRRREKDFVPLALSPDGRGALTRGAPRLQ